MSLVGCYVTPHPPIIVPEVGRERLGDVLATVEAMRRLGEEAPQLEPETIVVMSPHASVDPDRMGVGLAKRYRGDLGMFGAPQAALDLVGDVELGESIVREAVGRGLPVRPLRMQADEIELDHGVLVPLLFATRHLTTPPRLVVLTFSFLDLPAHLEFGRVVASAVEACGHRVLYIASGDMSHRLTPDAPAGYHPQARDFDEQVVAAFRAGDPAALLAIPEALRHLAGECGYRSLVALFGLLNGRHYVTRLLSYEGPFGVGYLVGSVDVMGADAEVEAAS